MKNKLLQLIVLVSGLCSVNALLAEAPVVNGMVNAAPPTQQYTEAHPHQNAPDTQPALTGEVALLNEITQLQQEVRQLRGSLEIQQHDLQLLQKQQLILYRDLDQRLAALGSSVKNNQTETAAPGIAITENLNTKTAEAKTSKPSADPKEEQAYQAAYQLILAKLYTDAIAAMQQFLKDYPHTHYQANAHYWLGQVYLVQDDLKEAAAEFNTVFTQYPADPKASSALFKLGYIDVVNQNYASAKDHFEQVKTRYPNTASAKAAEDKLTELSRAGYL